MLCSCFFSYAYLASPSSTASTPAADGASLQASKKAVYSIRVNTGWLGVGGNLRWIQSASMSNWGS